MAAMTRRYIKHRNRVCLTPEQRDEVDPIADALPPLQRSALAATASEEAVEQVLQEAAR
jgi:hypothetical protein